MKYISICHCGNLGWQSLVHNSHPNWTNPLEPGAKNLFEDKVCSRGRPKKLPLPFGSQTYLKDPKKTFLFRVDDFFGYQRWDIHMSQLPWKIDLLVFISSPILILPKPRPKTKAVGSRWITTNDDGSSVRNLFCQSREEVAMLHVEQAQGVDHIGHLCGSGEQCSKPFWRFITLVG